MANCNVQTLLSNASCFACLPPGTLAIVELQLLCEILNSPSASFNSGNLSLAASSWTVNHGLGGVPTYVYPVLVCTATDSNLNTVPGDEMGLPNWWNVAATKPALEWFANSTQIIVNSERALVGNEANFNVIHRPPGGYGQPSSFNNFAMKIYARL